MLVQLNVIFRVVQVIRANNIVFLDIKSYTVVERYRRFEKKKSLYPESESRNFRPKIERFPRQHGVAPQQTVWLKNKYVEIVKQLVSHSSSLSYYLKSSLYRNQGKSQVTAFNTFPKPVGSPTGISKI